VTGPRALACAAGLAFAGGLALGYLAGVSAPRAGDPARGPGVSAASSPDPAAGQSSPVSPGGPPNVTLSPRGPGGAGSSSPAAGRSPDDVGALGGAATLDRLLRRALEGGVEGAVERDGDAAAEAEALALASIRDAARGDPAALAALLDRLRTETDPRALELLAAAAAHIRDPQVEATALALAAPGPDRARRLAALSILDGLETEAALPLAAELVARERDPEIAAAALFALPPAGRVPADAASALVRDLSARARDPRSGEVRRRAVLALGDYGTAADLGPILEALRSDPDPAVRAGAAHALFGRRDAPPEAIRLLVHAVVTRDEHRDVRETAWYTLGSLGPLPPDARAARQAYAEEREGR